MSKNLERPWIRPVCSAPRPLSGCKVNPSAFRAISNADQPLQGGTFPQVFYQAEQFDLNCEYDPATSTFIPKQSGVYSLVASISFTPPTEGTRAIAMAIRVNGSPVITDREEFSFGTGNLDASGIVSLQAGDVVQVFATTSGVSVGTIESGVGTRFEGVRLT